MPTAGTTHDVTLSNGTQTYGFMVRPGSYRRERVDDFAPRIATGNDPTLREAIWDVWSQTGAPEGIDQWTVTNRNKIFRSDGNVFLGRSERIMLEAAWTASDTNVTATAPTITDFTTDLVCVGVATKVRRYSVAGGTWAASTTTLGANCVWLHVHGTRIFAAIGSSNDFVSSTDADTFAAPAAGERATCFTSWSRNNVQYLVKGNGSSFKLSSDGAGAVWGGAISVGNPATNITGLGTAFGLLIIGKADGLYYYDGVNVVEEMSFPNQSYSGNCKALVYHEGFLYTHILNRIVKLSFSSGGISNMVDVTPRMIGDENKELYNHGTPVWMWSTPSGLWVAFDNGESNQAEALTFNGLGWHQQFRSSASVDMLAGGYSRIGARTFLNAADGTANNGTYLRRHTTLTDLPYPAYSATGQFDTSDFDAGLPYMYKAFRDVMIEVENVSVGVEVQYSTDKGSNYTSIGTATGDGKVVFAFPGSNGVAAQHLRLRFILTRNSATSSPRLRRWAVSFLNRPNPIYGYGMTLEISPEQELRDATRETATVEERLQFLQSAEASRLPITFADLYGLSIPVYVTKTSQTDSPERIGTPIPHDCLMTVNLIQAYPFGLWNEYYWDTFYWG